MTANLSKAERVRSFLVAQPTLTHDQIARKCNTTKDYVDQVASRLRRKKKSLPDRRAARAAAVADHADAEVATPGDSASVPSSGIRLVTIERLTPPMVSKPAAWKEGYRCSVCGFEGEGKAPAACPKCGGA